MIFVSDGVGRALPGHPVLPKWGTFDGLYDAIEVVRARERAAGQRVAAPDASNDAPPIQCVQRARAASESRARARSGPPRRGC